MPNWIRKVKHTPRSIIDQCYVKPRNPDDVLFLETEVDGKMQLVANLHGYAIIPREEFAAQRNEVWEYKPAPQALDPQDVIPDASK